jgi:hypothetical protein
VGAVCEGRLVREVCFFKVAGGGPRDGLGFVFFSVEGFRVNVDFVVVALARLGERARAWCACNEFEGWALPDARLRDCLEAGGAAAAVFEPDEAVCAVKDAGSLIGRVGDRGLGFTNPVCGGEGGILVLGADP